jgi:hypothetical protein
MTAPTIIAALQKKALDQRAPSRHDDAIERSLRLPFVVMAFLQSAIISTENLIQR